MAPLNQELYFCVTRYLLQFVRQSYFYSQSDEDMQIHWYMSIRNPDRFDDRSENWSEKSRGTLPLTAVYIDQVSLIYRDSSIGNRIHIAVVKLLRLKVKLLQLR